MDQLGWQQSLLRAAADGLLSDSHLLVGLKLSHEMRWDTETPGLYWRNADACEAAGIARATFYKARRAMLDAGLLVEIGGNLHPSDSLCERPIVSVGDEKSLRDNEKSLRDNQCASAFAAAHSVDSPKALSLGPETTPAEISATYSQPEQFAQRAAATFVAVAYRRWPEAATPRFSALSRLFERGRETYPDAVLWEGMLRWIEDNTDSTGMRSPGAVFSKQAFEVFDEVSSERGEKEQAL